MQTHYLIKRTAQGLIAAFVLLAFAACTPYHHLHGDDWHISKRSDPTAGWNIKIEIKGKRFSIRNTTTKCFYDGYTEYKNDSVYFRYYQGHRAFRAAPCDTIRQHPIFEYGLGYKINVINEHFVELYAKADTVIVLTQLDN